MFPDWEAQPAVKCALSTLSGQREDESVCQDDPVPGVLGSCQTLRQSPPSRQHDHRQWQDQHYGWWTFVSSLLSLSWTKNINRSGHLKIWKVKSIYSQSCSWSVSCFRMFPWGSTTSRDERGEQFVLTRFRTSSFPPRQTLNMCPLSPRSKSQRKRFEEELNERMIRTIDGINSQK